MEPDYQFQLNFDMIQQSTSRIFAPNNYYDFESEIDYFHQPKLKNIFADIYNIMQVGTINGISSYLPSSPILTQSNFDESLYCNNTSRPPSCTSGICHCVHRLKVALNSVVELVIIDKAGSDLSIDHPFHLHGTPMYVKEMGSNVNNMGNVERDFYPIKDTISIPSQGYVIVRFLANNPGYWLLHCHLGKTTLDPRETFELI